MTRRSNLTTLSVGRSSHTARSTDKTVSISVCILLVIICGCLIGPWLHGFNFWETDLSLGASPPSLQTGHYLGTDFLGRDLLARILYGGRISLLVGVVGTLVAVLIGVPYGAMAAYAGGPLDNLMMRMIDILYSLPFLFLVILLVALFADPQYADSVVRFLDFDPESPFVLWMKGPGVRMLLLFIALGAISWLTMARIVRGQILSLKHQDFIEAARATGRRPIGIIAYHLIPNTTSVVIVYATLTIPAIILQEAFLSFLGLGIQPPQASWGTLINDGVRAMATAPWLLFFPSLILTTTLVCLNLLGDALQDRIDVARRMGP